MIKTVFDVYYLLLLVRVFMSWVRLGVNPVTRFIYEVTEPVLAIFRRLLPPSPSFPVDFSPIIAFVVLQLLESILLRVILLF